MKFRENRINWYTDDNGWNALYRATTNQHYNCVNILINSGIDVNSKTSNNNTSLDIAAYYGYSEIVDLLLTRGANVNRRDSSNQTALNWAANRGKREVVTLLLNKGAVIDDDIETYDPENDWR